MSDWECGSSKLTVAVQEQTAMCLSVYAEDSSRVLQDANNERRISEGGYATRQLEELLQNAVDAARSGGERVEMLLTQDTLYVANDGAPFDERGVLAIMASDISAKDDETIGKFGIGFKSVLAVSDSPKVFSRTVSFGFDKAWAARILSEAGFNGPLYPTMRLARTLDPVSEGSAQDDHLREFMEWASTVVVVPLSVPPDVLSPRITDFPAEFVLFSPHIKQARLRNLTVDGGTEHASEMNQRGRSIGQALMADGTVSLRSGGATSRWVVTSTIHCLSASAREEGGYVASREQVQVQYALPVPSGTNRVGRIWAYFPTHFDTTLTGFINAPWKLSDDRTGLLEGQFNMEMLDKVPQLFSNAIQFLSGTDEAVAAIDAMPARGQESRNWVDREINEPIFQHLRNVPSLPDGNGVLKLPSALKWVGDVPYEWLAQWASVDGAPVDEWLHPSAYRSPERRKKIIRLKQPDNSRTGSTENIAEIHEWLEALVTDGSAEASAAAILLAANILDDVQRTGHVRSAELSDSVRKARIIRLDDAEFRAPIKGKVFVRVAGDHSSDVDFVDPRLATMQGIPEALERLGIVVMDRTGELHRLIAEAKSIQGRESSENVWHGIWNVLRDIQRETAIRILSEELGGQLELHVRVRTAAGQWLPIAQAYLAGRIIAADGRRDRERLIDPLFHGPDEDLLHDLGAVDAPVWRYSAPRESWMDAYEVEMRDLFIAAQPRGGSKPDRSKIEITAGTKGAPPPWPLSPLMDMSAEGVAAATRHIMDRPPAGHWNASHASNPNYGSYVVVTPEVWFLRNRGLLHTAHGIRGLSGVLHASESIDPAVLPAVEISDEWARRLEIKTDPADLPTNEWVALKEVADTWQGGSDDDIRRTAFYTWLPGRIECDRLIARVGQQLQSVEVKNIGVADEQAIYESMMEAQIPALLVPDHDDAERFIDNWEMPRGQDLLQEEVVVEASGEASYLTDLFPPLRLHLDPADQVLKFQPASRLVKMTATPRGQVARPIRALRDGDSLLITATTTQEQLAQVSDILGLDLGQPGIAKILHQIEQTAANRLRNEIKWAPTDDERLVAAVGIDALRRCVPAQALEVLDQEDGVAAPEDVAALARAVHGVSILKTLRLALDERGLEPPREWSGRRVTRQWVASLGFPIDWAGFPDGSRDAVEVIDGPAVLKPLHDYQEFVTDRIKGLLGGDGSDRGMLSLPTGAGKTRVTVQAIVNAVRLGDVCTDGPLIWIAQTDELCEQAAETWTHVWRAIGPQVPMRLGRLWANNEVSEEPGTFQLVVATIGKLGSLMTRPGEHYEWLREASVLVVDEAHTSIAPSYTRVLEWLGRGGRSRNREDRRPLIGLTATPFRGTSAEETERLAGRYGRSRLDRGAFRKEDPYEELQDMEVLAQVRHEILDGTDVELTAKDVAEIERLRHLPSAVTDRLGANLARTLRVVDSIGALPDDWSVLAFAPSVENARVLAALLSHRGIPAVSVSADTEPAARRHYIQEFKDGRMRVLTNYNVLTQGFDAPRIQAVYVARPTFSPNIYQQMIGRGLRGPKNGGSEEVLIVNVQDNFQKFGELLAFNEFEYLWTKR